MVSQLPHVGTVAIARHHRRGGRVPKKMRQMRREARGESEAEAYEVAGGRVSRESIRVESNESSRCLTGSVTFSGVIKGLGVIHVPTMRYMSCISCGCRALKNIPPYYAPSYYVAVIIRSLNHDSVAVEFPFARRAGGARQEIAG